MRASLGGGAPTNSGPLGSNLGSRTRRFLGIRNGKRQPSKKQGSWSDDKPLGYSQSETEIRELISGDKHNMVSFIVNPRRSILSTRISAMTRMSSPSESETMLPNQSQKSRRPRLRRGSTASTSTPSTWGTTQMTRATR